MPRIAGVDVPNDKQIGIAMRYIYGVGPYVSKMILKDAEIDETVRAKDLTESQVTGIANVISRDYIVEGQLRRQVQQNIA